MSSLHTFSTLPSNQTVTERFFLFLLLFLFFRQLSVGGHLGRLRAEISDEKNRQHSGFLRAHKRRLQASGSKPVTDGKAIV